MSRNTYSSTKTGKVSLESLLSNDINTNSSASLSILEVVLSFNLNWNLHINHVVKKDNWKLGALYRFDHSLNTLT